MGRGRRVRFPTEEQEDLHGVHAGRRRTRVGQDARHRLLPDDHLEVRGNELVLPEHVQPEAAAQEVAGGGGEGEHVCVGRGAVEDAVGRRRIGKQLAEEEEDLDTPETEGGAGEDVSGWCSVQDARACPLLVCISRSLPYLATAFLKEC